MESKKMRILQVTPYFGEHYGGTERYSFNLSRALVKLGHEVHVYAARIKSSTPRKEIRYGINIHRFPTPTTIWNINPFSVMLHRLLTKKFDVIHAHSYLYATSNQALLAKMVRNFFHKHTKLIVHLHGGLGIPPYLKHQPLKKIAKYVYDATVGKAMMFGANHILSACQTDAILAQRQFNIPDEKITVIYNAIDTVPFNAQRKDGDGGESPYLLFVGDLERWKGVTSLIQAMQILKNRGHKIALKLAGVGSIERLLRKMSDGLDIRFLGAVPHSKIPDLMRDAFACVLPSFWEGVPTVGMEAMASGTPFIGTNIGGIPELIDPEVTGLLISPNAPWEIADAVQKLRNENLRQTIVKNAYQLINQKFAIETIAKKTARIYKRISGE
ncbi:MAG: glycosyltransferase family 4 protein [Promethearchaeota archaeon]